jgi:aspartyl/glutamyl-tRNA(Asn/Gln) amidotransferase subunit A (EC 6.3.5.-)
MDLSTLTIHEAHERLKNRDFSARELTQTILKRIEEVEPKVKAYIIVTSEKALKEAEQADEIIAAGKITPLTGIPLAIKDVLCTEGITTTCGFKDPQQFCSGL